MTTRRRLKWAGLLLLLVASGYAAFWVYIWRRDAADYDAALAELDRARPGWRLADPRPGRAAPPDDRNAALLIQNVHDRLPPGKVDRELARLAGLAGFADQVGPEDDSWLGPLLADAHKLAALTEGRFPARPSGADWLPGGPTQHHRAVREVARLLYLDGLQAARRGDYECAARAAAALANAAGALDGEPLRGSIAARQECRGLLAQLLQDMLGGGIVPAATLEACAGALREEPPEALADFARAELALCHACLEDARAGRLTHPDLPRGLWRKRCHGRALRGLAGAADLIEARAGGPTEAARDPLAEVDEALRAAGGGAGGEEGRAWGYLRSRHLSTLRAVADEVAYANGRVRCARAALAAERYRLAHGAWPAGPADLVPGLLPGWPADPRDGRPLQWEAVPEGLAFSADRGGTGRAGGPEDAPAWGDVPGLTPMLAPSTRFTLLEPKLRRHPEPGRP
jgi:hypothetical protein